MPEGMSEGRPDPAPADPSTVPGDPAARRFLRGYLRDALLLAVLSALLGRGIRGGFGGGFAWDGLAWTLAVAAANVALLAWMSRTVLRVQAGLESPGIGAALASSLLLAKPVAVLAVFGALLSSYGAIPVATGLVLSIALLCIRAWVYSTCTGESEYEAAPKDRLPVTLEP